MDAKYEKITIIKQQSQTKIMEIILKRMICHTIIKGILVFMVKCKDENWLLSRFNDYALFLEFKKNKMAEKRFILYLHKKWKSRC